MPRNVAIVGLTSNSITISWDAPLDLGGREDVSYRLCYERDGAEECTTAVMDTIDTITGIGYTKLKAAVKCACMQLLVIVARHHLINY